MSNGGIDTSMYAPQAHKSIMERGAEMTALVNSVTQNELMRTSIQAEQLKIAIEQIDGMRKDFAALAGKKNPTIADAQRIIKLREDLGLINPSDSAVWQSEIPANEEELNDWAKDQMLKAGSMAEMADLLYQQVQVDQGSQITTFNMDRRTGLPSTPPVVMEKGMTPAEQMARVDTVKNGQRGSIPVTAAPGFPNELLNPGGPMDASGNPFFPDAPATLPGAPLGDEEAPPPPDEMLPGGAAPEPLKPAVITEDPFLPTEAAPGDLDAVAEFTKAKQEQDAFRARTTPLLEALEKIKKTGTGPGTESVNEVRSFLLSMEPMIEELVGRDIYNADPIPTADYDTLRKYMNQYSLATAKGLGATADQLSATAGASPGTHISQMANEQVLRMNLALERMQRARVQEFMDMVENGEAAETDWLDYAQEWGDNRDVRAYAADQMTPAELKKMLKGMTPTERRRFEQTLDAAADVGLIDIDKIGGG